MNKFKTRNKNTLSAKNITAVLALIFSTVFPVTSYGLAQELLSNTRTITRLADTRL